MHHATPLIGSPNTCANCAATLVPDARFCSHCGQKTPTRRLETKDLLHDFIHALTHVDHSVWALLRGLIIRPGRIAREYVDGHRKRYFGPFVFLVVMVGLSTLLIQSTGFLVAISGSTNPVSGFVQRHVNLVMLAQVPILALYCTLIFRRDKLFFAENAVLVAYLSGIRSLFFLVIELPLYYAVGGGAEGRIATAAYLLLWTFYFGFGASQFYHGHRAWSFAKGVAAAVLTWATTVALIAIGAFVYFAMHGRP
jgi:Protein of unknown function (DUF3667)